MKMAHDLNVVSLNHRYDYTVVAVACAGHVSRSLVEYATQINAHLLEDADVADKSDHPAVVFVTDQNGVDGDVSRTRGDSYLESDINGILSALRHPELVGKATANLICVDSSWPSVGYESVYDVLVELDVHRKLRYSRIPDLVASFTTANGKTVLFTWTFSQ